MVGWYCFWFHKNVRITERVHEVTHLIAANLGQHHGQQRVRRDIERNAEEDVSTALIELAGQLAVGHIELKQAVAGRQGHAVHVARVPGRNDVAA